MSALLRSAPPPADRRTADRCPADPSAEVTFRGRGLALRSGGGFVLLVCPLCSQRNGRRGAGRGVCEWCAYEPAAIDIEPARAARGA